jgi:hypothetical protein
MHKFTMALLLSVVLCSAATITYDVNQTVGAGGVTGFVETDGTIGVLSASNILDWNLVVNEGNTNPTFDILGPLSGSNSVVGVVGTDLSATATQLLFNFSGTDSGYALFQHPSLFAGSDFWCLSSADQGCSIVPPGGEVVKACCVNVGESLSGTDVIASASGVPEPSTLSFLGLGMAVLGFWRFRVSKPRRQRAH